MHNSVLTQVGHFECSSRLRWIGFECSLLQVEGIKAMFFSYLPELQVFVEQGFIPADQHIDMFCVANFILALMILVEPSRPISELVREEYVSSV